MGGQLNVKSNGRVKNGVKEMAGEREREAIAVCNICACAETVVKTASANRNNNCNSIGLFSVLTVCVVCTPLY